jgi:hypothetical protein
MFQGNGGGGDNDGGGGKIFCFTTGALDSLFMAWSRSARCLIVFVLHDGAMHAG